MLVKALISHEFSLRIKAQEKKKPKPQLPNYGDKERIEELIAEAEDKFSDRADIEQYLGGEQFVENKRAVEHYRMKNYVDDAKALILNFPDVNPVSAEDKQVMKRIIELANAGKWTQAVALLEQQEVAPQDLLDTLMLVALYSAPDLAITQQLLDDGARIPDDAMNWLARKNDVARAKQMLPFGLQLYVRKGHISSSIIAIKSKSYDLLKFVLENGVNLDANDAGMDELDYVLLDYIRNPLGDQFLSLLFEHGAKVENSHFELVQSIQDKDLAAYGRLIANWPQLASEQ